jgi:hypothetical protein
MGALKKIKNMLAKLLFNYKIDFLSVCNGRKRWNFLGKCRGVKDLSGRQILSTVYGLNMVPYNFNVGYG